MRIDISSPAASLLPADWGNTQAKKGASGADSTAEDRATFSSAGNTVQALTARALAMPEVRQDRVDVLRQSVSAGTYSLDANKTAAAIVESGEQ